jgi:phosphohistidine phosphatase SixA
MRPPGRVVRIDMVRDEQARTYFAPTHDIYFLPDSNPGAPHLLPHLSRGMTGHLRVLPPETGTAIVLLVRHADKASVASLDPPLSETGEARAAALADALRDAGVTRILVDQSQRTQQTAIPLSRRGLHAEVIPIDWNDPTAQVHAIADSARRPGAVTLVIGHRNTVPETIRLLGGPTVPEMRDTDYDDLYIMVLGPGSATPVLIHASYGGR